MTNDYVNNRRPYGVVNPRAALGKTRRLWPSLREQLEKKIGTFPWDWTSAPMQAADLVRNALKMGCNFIISVGGDGTLNEVINGFFSGRLSINPQAILAIVSCGSGSDFGRSLGVSGDITETLNTILTGRPRQIDVGHLAFTLATGERSERLFLNIASLGLPAQVCQNLSNQPHFLGGSGRFFLATIQALLQAKNQLVTLKVDGKTLPEQVINTAAVANGRFFGGGMQVAPQAQLDDGLLDLVLMGAVGIRDFVLWGPRFYQGQHLKHPRIKLFQAHTIHAVSQAPVPVEADGEPLGTLPATYNVLPGAVRVLFPR
jgi:YegS/Rv2252/BmrU family lipid kinase